MAGFVDTLPGVSLAKQVEERGGVQKDRVITFSANNCTYDENLKTSHRAHTRGQRGQDFSLHDPAGGVTYHAVHRWGPAERGSPRHHHDFEQIRFVLSGEMEYNQRRYGAGWLGYFPEGVFYGPEAKTQAGSQVVCQLPGPSGRHLVARYEMQAARQAIRDGGGRFENGLCIHPDGRRQDGAEACMEWLFGPVSYPPARYDEQVWINTENFTWQPTGLSGVSVKRLAMFNANGPAIQLLRLEPGASTASGSSDSRTIIRWIYRGEVEYAGESCPSTPDESVSNIAYLPGAEYEALSSDSGATLLSVELNIPDGEPPYVI